MKLRTYFAAMLATAAIMGCGSSDSTQDARMKIEAFDAPPSPGKTVPAGVEHVYLTIDEISVHSNEQDDWIVLSDEPTQLDFLSLVNGVTGTLADAELPPGTYSQLRLVVNAEDGASNVVVDGTTHELFIPSGTSSGVKLNLHFTVEEDEIIEVYVDVDLARSIWWNKSGYRLQPVFKAFKKTLSGTVAGEVLDADGNPIANATVHAISGNDTTTTIASEAGAYKLILLEGTYDVEAGADGYTSADTSYDGLAVTAGEDLVDKDFVLTQ